MGNMKISENSIKYILFQRTGYLKDNMFFKLLTYFGSVTPFYNLSVNLKKDFFSSKIKTEFEKDIVNEYSIIKKYLPKSAGSILDIGCGVAGIDILLSHHYKNKIDIFLIDKTKVDKKVHYDYEKSGSFYNSLQISKSLLEINGVDTNKIHLQEAIENNEIKFNQGFDIVISLISWGFHYPVSAYLFEVYRKMNKNGILLLDIRKNANGEKEIEKRFGNYQIIFQTKKYMRVFTKKNK